MSAELREGETVKPLELFFDLAFVLVFTQCTALMADDPTWAGIGRGVLVLAVLWWAWVGYAWLTSVLDPEEGAIRIVMFAAMAALLVAALCVPEAFGDRALEFAVAYAVLRFAHIALFVIASREDPELRHSVVGTRDQHLDRRRADLRRGVPRQPGTGAPLAARGRPRRRRTAADRRAGGGCSRATSRSGTT